MGILKSILPETVYTRYLRWKNAVTEEKIMPEDEQILNQRKDFYSAFIRSGSLVFDVGANYGNRIIPFLQLGAGVVAVEPQQKCADYLEKTFSDKIKLLRKGLGEKNEKKQFYISTSSTLSSFSTDWIDKVKNAKFKYYEWKESVEMEMTTLDTLIGEYGTPDFIKIDVEGYEPEVLKGQTMKIRFLSFEYTTPECEQKAIDCIDRLEHINPAVRCNYSAGEGMQLELSEWVAAADMKRIIRSAAFRDSGFGDIYVRND